MAGGCEPTSDVAGAEVGALGAVAGCAGCGSMAGGCEPTSDVAGAELGALGAVAGCVGCVGCGSAVVGCESPVVAVSQTLPMKPAWAGPAARASNSAMISVLAANLRQCISISET